MRPCCCDCVSLLDGDRPLLLGVCGAPRPRCLPNTGHVFSCCPSSLSLLLAAFLYFQLLGRPHLLLSSVNFFNMCWGEETGMNSHLKAPEMVDFWASVPTRQVKYWRFRPTRPTIPKRITILEKWVEWETTGRRMKTLKYLRIINSFVAKFEHFQPCLRQKGR